MAFLEIESLREVLGYLSEFDSARPGGTLFDARQALDARGTGPSPGQDTRADRSRIRAGLQQLIDAYEDSSPVGLFAGTGDPQGKSALLLQQGIADFAFSTPVQLQEDNVESTCSARVGDILVLQVWFRSTIATGTRGVVTAASDGTIVAPMGVANHLPLEPPDLFPEDADLHGGHLAFLRCLKPGRCTVTLHERRPVEWKSARFDVTVEA